MRKEVLLKEEILSDVVLEKEINNCLLKVDNLMLKTKDEFFLSPNTNELKKYDLIGHTQWTSSFYTGMLWLSYEYTNDDKYKNLAQKHTIAARKRLEAGGGPVENHDLGFIYSLSAFTDYKFTKSEYAKNLVVDAADKLMLRYISNAKIIQAWGKMGEPGENSGRIIIDTYMNLPFLFRASELTGDNKYRDAAINHAKMATKYLIREDYTSNHTYHFDPTNGKPIKTTTHQGLNDTSCWARGQSWAIYGLALLYKFTNERFYLDMSINVLNKFIELLSEDGISFWDFDCNDFKDASAMAITACGVLELSKYTNYDENVSLANAIISKLINNHYISYDKNEDGILNHSCYHYHKNFGRDSFVAWGDYYYFEALIRLNNPKWDLYW